MIPPLSLFIAKSTWTRIIQQDIGVISLYSRKAVGETILERERYHQLMFLTAAIWNWTLAIAFLVLPRIDMNYFLVTGLVIPNTMLWFDSFMGLVFAFGLGFYFVSRNVKENHGLIQMAVFEKTWVFLIAILWFVFGQASILVIAFATVDMIFGLLFIEDLLAIRKLN